LADRREGAAPLVPDAGQPGRRPLRRGVRPAAPGAAAPPGLARAGVPRLAGAGVQGVHHRLARTPGAEAPADGGLSMKTISFNGTAYTCPFLDAMPPLSAEERAELEADIKAHGVTVPVVVTDENEVIDGHHRLEIAAGLGLPDVPFRVLAGLTTAQKRGRAEEL